MFKHIAYIDIIDVLILTILVYQVMLILPRTRATQLIFGLLYFAGLFLIAYIFQMEATLWVFEKFAIVIPVALLIIFSPSSGAFSNEPEEGGF